MGRIRVDCQPQPVTTANDDGHAFHWSQRFTTSLTSSPRDPGTAQASDAIIMRRLALPVLHRYDFSIAFCSARVNLPIRLSDGSSSGYSRLARGTTNDEHSQRWAVSRRRFDAPAWMPARIAPPIRRPLLSLPAASSSAAAPP